MTDESVRWTKKVQQAARNFNHLNENPGTEAKSGKINQVSEFFSKLLVLLCHKFFRSKICWQHGQRGSVREIARAMAMRTEVIEFGT